MHGKGIYTWADGRKYEGDYVNDKKEGFGSYLWTDGRKYEGQWINGKQHGRGRYLGVDGSMKFGTWEDGKRIEWVTAPENEGEWLQIVPANFPKNKGFASPVTSSPSPNLPSGSTPAKQTMII